ncbi:hypothetical protein SAMD00019534_012150 [Acytostelium subglobosum LB1]|uniref:hypothetical protein n=1 Tax=Acytostelium subglobosum LB1 TaxID=1410327 RepID=UPI000644C2A0|nr:hypothetical protein SAMD00019534_012150 [Acytostelium subglobosum LB1]GAM18040.1 hypothetical protein SAMD00019534_012150 [Acytostelium subglobosum LB1]|eukprot:XP_012758636.1 hypothetical protein SAMD00019534_012150 [Acytostelium subglobosum LB1]
MDEFQITRNESWMRESQFWRIYIAGLLLAKLVIQVLSPEFQYAWLTVTIMHAAVTYCGLHWQKGLPFLFHQGKYSRLTLWEQIDKGQQYTPTRKFFTLVPIVLFMITLNDNGYGGIPFYLNAVPTFILLLAKMPQLHRVRIFGINKY